MQLPRIKALREDRDIRQREMAELLHIKQGTYSDYENGVIHIPVEALVRIAEYYKVSLDYLVGRTDDPTPPKRTN